MLEMLDKIDARRPLLIAGPTASGKSSLALRVAEAQGGVIINADALQVFDCWQLLSARPDADDLARARHLLYGHIPYDADYSTGHWLREVAPLLDGERPIIVGGTGLNFTALTEGLADIPPIPESVRTKSRELPTDVMLAELDAKTHERIDTQNPARIRRAWEVLRGTEKPIWAWQDDTPPPLLPIDQATGIVLDAAKDWLDARIAQRFEQMIANGALHEVDAMRSDWDPERPSSKAIGAPELMAYLNDEIPLKDATELSITASRQYAKRQRTWFRARMKNWQRLDARDL